MTPSDRAPERRKNDRRAKAALSLSIVTLVISVFGVGTIAVVALHNVGSIGDLEAKDTAASRNASARLCERGNYTRAELHVAYAQPPTPQSVIDAAIASGEPILASLLRAQRPSLSKSLKRVRTLNPILWCEPNLEGRAAQVRSPLQQKAFVELYKDLKLKPLPNFAPPK